MGKVFRQIIWCGALLFLGRAFVIAGACGEEVDKYCNDVEPGRGHVADCLNRFQHHVSDACKKDLAKYGKELKEITEACSGDAYEFCRDVRAGRGRIKKCLMDNERDLTPECRKQLVEKTRPHAGN